MLIFFRLKGQCLFGLSPVFIMPRKYSTNNHRFPVWSRVERTAFPQTLDIKTTYHCTQFQFHRNSNFQNKDTVLLFPSPLCPCLFPCALKPHGYGVPLLFSAHALSCPPTQTPTANPNLSITFCQVSSNDS